MPETPKTTGGTRRRFRFSLQMLLLAVFAFAALLVARNTLAPRHVHVTLIPNSIVVGRSEMTMTQFRQHIANTRWPILKKLQPPGQLHLHMVPDDSRYAELTRMARDNGVPMRTHTPIRIDKVSRSPKGTVVSWSQ